MDYSKVAKEILELVGGEKNIETVAHCATRLRFVLKDESKANKKAVEKLNEVKGVFSNSGQFQIIIGQGAVNKVYKELATIANIKESSTSEAKKMAMKNMNPLQRFARMLSNIFVPIIPAIVASGLLMGTLGMCTTFGWLEGDSGLFTLLNMFSNAAFIFLPILIAFSAAKEFGANPYLAAALGGILIHPALQNAWTLGGGIEKTITVFGMEVGMVGYQGTVLPILFAVWIMGYVERSIRKVVPNILDIIVTPFLTLMITGFISLLVIGPFGRLLGDGISVGLNVIYESAGAFAGLLFGGLYSSIVITGIHHSFHAIEAGLLANPEIGRNFLLPIWSMANVAQGGAAFAVFFKTKNKKLKSIALPAGTSCLLGITEAAIFGVNLRLVRPFIAAAIGGALGGAYMVLMNVAMTAVGVTGIPGTAIVESASMINYLIGLVIAFGGAFIATYILGFKDEASNEVEEDIKEEVEEETKEVKVNSQVIVSPMRGKAISIEEVPDNTFANKFLGDGIAIEPEDGLVVAPVDGTIAHIFETKHAIAIKTETGVELLIHVGIDTVKMNGEGFEAFIKAGDKVKAGDKLLKVDLDLVKEKAKSTITPIVVTNTDNFESIEKLKEGKVDIKDEVIKVNMK
ncbi:sucrose-specific PTS transporter subunit IIBC [Caldisalinibacter kiritimatiensis]|uniref:PTS system, sucrose-specific component IIB / IIC n=1 Tax=Caldisalinibacter kiritimatiensis TaxID=1304284 RepID=R1AV99_9FIRM|nr:sucrose-specific PTS transporter subunit IIBC [Caldisalinibacter kiritimatiensis]EOD01118.1 PTS system, sucrose-specific component IIB / IIC [Caldisalinibacter kiritimatiensis]